MAIRHASACFNSFEHVPTIDFNEIQKTKQQVGHLRRRKLPTSGLPPNSWCLVRDLSPEFVVYMRGPPQGRALPAALRADGIPAARNEPAVLQVRIVTEKDRGNGQIEFYEVLLKKL